MKAADFNAGNRAIAQFMEFRPELAGLAGDNMTGQSWLLDRSNPLYELAKGSVSTDQLLFYTDWRWLMAVIDKIGAFEDSPRSLAPGQWVLIRIELKLCGMFLIMHCIEADGSSRRRYSYDEQIGDPGVRTRLLAWWKVASDFCQDWVNVQIPAHQQEDV